MENKIAGRFSLVGIVKILLVGLISWYQYLISPFLPKSCRFAVSCSEYAKVAITDHGIIKGCWLIVGRLFRCQAFWVD